MADERIPPIPPFRQPPEIPGRKPPIAPPQVGPSPDGSPLSGSTTSGSRRMGRRAAIGILSVAGVALGAYALSRQSQPEQKKPVATPTSPEQQPIQVVTSPAKPAGATPTNTPRPIFAEPTFAPVFIPTRAPTPTKVEPTAIPMPFWERPASSEVLRSLSAGDRIKINVAMNRPITAEITPAEATEFLRVHKIAEEVIRAEIRPQVVERVNLGFTRNGYTPLSGAVVGHPLGIELQGKAPLETRPNSYPLPAMKGIDGTVHLLFTTVNSALSASPYDVKSYTSSYMDTLPPNMRNTYDMSVDGIKQIMFDLALDPQTGVFKIASTQLNIEPLFYHYMRQLPGGETEDSARETFAGFSEKRKREIAGILQRQMVNPVDVHPFNQELSEGFSYNTALGRATVTSFFDNPEWVIILHTAGK